MIRNIRYRRDQRQLEEEEEMWFNEEDDFTDVVPTSKTDIDPYSEYSCSWIFYEYYYRIDQNLLQTKHNWRRIFYILLSTISWQKSERKEWVGGQIDIECGELRWHGQW